VSTRPTLYGAAARRVARDFPSFRDFVDDALFDPRWGYYSTGQVRFGEGGHYDTFPLALSPFFGRMVATYAHQRWRRAGRPARFEICELGAGNGQLALDVLIAIDERAERGRDGAAFARACRYRIIERSPSLIARQRQQLGPAARRVTWTRADLSQRPARGAPFAEHGLVFANEVLDCLSHHKIVRARGGIPGVVFVVPVLDAAARIRRGTLRLLPGLQPHQRAVPRRALARVFQNERLRHHLRFDEVVLPLQAVPGLHEFVWRQCPELFEHRARFKPYFACPAIEPLIRHTARLYRRSEMLWIDYGASRKFHLTSGEAQRIFAGPPRSGASVYRAPGLDDITFLVDFSVVATAAWDAGLQVVFYGPQGELARRTRTVFDRAARDLILRCRLVSWLLAVAGVGPERAWRHTGLTWSAGEGGRVRDDVKRAVDEFAGKRSSNFKLMILGESRRRRRGGVQR